MSDFDSIVMGFFVGFAVYAFLSAFALIWQGQTIKRLEAEKTELRVELQRTKLYVAKEYKDIY